LLAQQSPPQQGPAQPEAWRVQATSLEPPQSSTCGRVPSQPVQAVRAQSQVPSLRQLGVQQEPE
jgi:hypothetical protein